jgi:phage tail sheath gpL-like
MGQVLSTVPVSLRRPGVYSQFTFNANPGSLVALPKLVVIVAEAKGGSAAFGTPIQIFSAADGDAKLGQGTFAALGARMAFAVGALRGTTPQVWVCPVAEAGSGAAAVETITITASSAQAGNLAIQICGRTINVGVSAGDSATTIASNLLAQIQANYAILPITATAAAGVVTGTNITKGLNGNDVTYATISAPTGVAVAYAQSTAGSGVADPTTALEALYDKRYHAVCLSNHLAADIALCIADRAVDWGYAQANYKYYFLGSTASLGTATTLAGEANDFGVGIVTCTGCPNLPVELAVAVGTSWFSHDAPNYNMDGETLPLVPPSGANAYSDAQIESALGGGLTPLTPAGLYVKVERLTSTETTVNSAPFEPTRDMGNTRTSAELAEQIAIAIATGLPQQTLTDAVLDDVRDIVVQVDRIFETNGYITGVDGWLPQIIAEISDNPPGRVNVVNPHTPVGALHQVVNENNMYQQ